MCIKHIQNPIKHKNDLFNNTIYLFRRFKSVKEYPKAV